MFKKKEQANELLRYAILVCKGGGFSSPAPTRFAILLRLKDDLESIGATWQVNILNHWVHRFQKENKTVLQNPERILITKKVKIRDSKGGDVLVWYKNIP